MGGLLINQRFTHAETHPIVTSLQLEIEKFYSNDGKVSICGIHSNFVRCLLYSSVLGVLAVNPKIFFDY